MLGPMVSMTRRVKVGSKRAEAPLVVPLVAIFVYVLCVLCVVVVVVVVVRVCCM